MLRAAATPERFLTRGFGRWLQREGGEPSPQADVRLGIAMPRELAKLLAIVAGRRVGPFVPKTQPATFPGRDRARLIALLAGAIPFGTVRPSASKEIWLWFLGDAAGAGRGVVASLDPAVPSAPRLVCRGASSFAAMCSLQTSVPTPGVAEQEAVRAAFERARTLVDLLTGQDPALRRAAKKLVHKPLVVPPPPKKGGARAVPLALGAVVEAFFRFEDEELAAVLQAHAHSRDEVVARACRTFAKPTADLSRRRALALRAGRATESTEDRVPMTKKLVETAATTTGEIREEALLALAELGDRAVVPALSARAVTGDPTAIDALAALGDRRAIPSLASLLRSDDHPYRHLEVPVVRALAALGAKTCAPALRSMLLGTPLSNWRDGIAHAPVVKELVHALGELRAEEAGPDLLAVLGSNGQEYRAILPIAAWSLGRIAHAPALPTLERLLTSPKEPPTCEAVWAVGEIALAGDRDRAAILLEETRGLEPGAEAVRLTALVKAGRDPKWTDLRRAIDRALWEPAFRGEETSRRRVWALQSLEELAPYVKKRKAESDFFLGHEAIRLFVTRDDHRVRAAAEQAFAAWAQPVPKTRRYYPVILASLEARGGLDALHEAVRDPLGVFRHNAATRIAERGDPSSVRPLAEATARLFAEPPTSTYEYDDAPYSLVAFVRALAKLNRPEGNDVLIDGLRAGNHQVRAVVAENTPDDRRFVPELMAMLGDPRSFLRSRAERSLAALGVNTPASDPPPRRLEL